MCLPARVAQAACHAGMSCCLTGGATCLQAWPFRRFLLAAAPCTLPVRMPSASAGRSCLHDQRPMRECEKYHRQVNNMHCHGLYAHAAGEVQLFRRIPTCLERSNAPLRAWGAQGIQERCGTARPHQPPVHGDHGTLLLPCLWLFSGLRSPPQIPPCRSTSAARTPRSRVVSMISSLGSWQSSRWLQRCSHFRVGTGRRRGLCGQGPDCLVGCSCSANCGCMHAQMIRLSAAAPSRSTGLLRPPCRHAVLHISAARQNMDEAPAQGASLAHNSSTAKRQQLRLAQRCLCAGARQVLGTCT